MRINETEMTQHARRLALIVAAIFSFHISAFSSAVSAASNAPRLSEDFKSIMEWLSAESAEGMAFHSAVSFDPPVELPPGGVGFDGNFGLGTVPLHKNTFPTLQVKTLQDTHPEQNFSDTTMFPDMTGHLRYGFEDRWEGALRFSDMTVPRYKISPTTEGEGQSNILGVQIRKHMGDPKLERVTVYASYDYIFGGFKFFNGFQHVAVTDTLFLDSKNEGLLAWNIKTVGAGFMISHEWGRYVPYYGFGYNYSEGVVHTRLKSVFDGGLVSPVVGEGSHSVMGTQQLRMTLGTMRHGRKVNWYAATEILLFGSKSGRAFAVHMGFSVPIRMGASEEQLSRPESELKDAPRDLDAEELPSSMIILR